MFIRESKYISSSNNEPNLDYNIEDPYYNIPWSRVYEYPLIIDKIEELKKSKSPKIHNTSWGFCGTHIKFKNELDLRYDCLHTDLKESNLEKTGIYNITQKPPRDWIENFDFVLNVSTIEEVDSDPFEIMENLYSMVKPGGFLILTIDSDGIDLNEFEKRFGQIGGNDNTKLDGDNSIARYEMYKDYYCFYVIIEKISYTAILNLFKRPEYLIEQINSIKNQTCKPSEIILWNNSGSSLDELDVPDDVIKINCSKNFGPWGRFTGALNSKSEYILTVDDDIIPGRKWVENCYQTHLETGGMSGGYGVIFNGKGYNYYTHTAGWTTPLNSQIEVDVCGHTLFFKKSWLKYYWLDNEITEENFLCGEDMSMSYSIRKHLGLKTFVPPHPFDCLDKWSSDPIKANQYNSDGKGISSNENSSLNIMKYAEKLIDLGHPILEETDLSIFKVDKADSHFSTTVKTKKIGEIKVKVKDKEGNERINSFYAEYANLEYWFSFDFAVSNVEYYLNEIFIFSFDL